MCWSGQASGAVAVAGFCSSVYFAAIKKEDFRLWGILGYFSLMEMLQAYTYTVIGRCELPDNQIATLLGWLHIAFQPIFINLYMLYFLPIEVRKKIEMPIMAIVAVFSVMLLVQAYPFAWAAICDATYNAFCGGQICSTHGSWHIAWQMPRRDILLGSQAYIIPVFFLPLLYGSWKFNIYHIITGPLLAYLTTASLNEMAAVWCLYSFFLLLVSVETPLRRALHVKKWYFWSYPKFVSKQL